MNLLRSNNQRGSLLTPSLNLDFSSGVMPPGLAFSRSSIGMYFNSAGILATASSNVPRFLYDPVSLACRGLLAEESRTNSNTNSNSFASGTRGSYDNITTTANATTSPDGTSNATRITENSATSTHRILGTNMGAIAASTTYVFSLFVKPDQRYRLSINFSTAGWSDQRISYNLNTQTYSITGTATAGIKTCKDGWYQIWCSATSNASGNASPIMYYELNNASGALSYTGDGTSGLYFYGIQLEVGSLPTSYIPTASSAVTRAVDVCTITAPACYNSNQGTLYAEFYNNAGFDQQVFGFGLTSDPASQNIRIRKNSSNVGVLVLRKTGQSAGDITTSGTAFTSNNAIVKVMGSYNIASGSAAISMTGATQGTGTPGASISSLAPSQATAYIGGSTDMGMAYVNNAIRRIAHYPVSLPNSSVQLLIA